MSDQWQYRASIYGWFPDIGGKTTFPAGTGSSIGVDASQIIDGLKFTFMGTFEAQKGPWGVFTDVVYLDVGGSKSQPATSLSTDIRFRLASPRMPRWT